MINGRCRPHTTLHRERDGVRQGEMFSNRLHILLGVSEHGLRPGLIRIKLIWEISKHITLFVGITGADTYNVITSLLRSIDLILIDDA